VDGAQYVGTGPAYFST